MKTLIITAHPSSSGFTHKIAATYKKEVERQGNEVEIIDLYKPENRQDFLKFEDVKNISPDERVCRMQEKISKSDELVFIFPLWWYGEPAILKNFWDNNFTPRFAYRYIDGKPTGLLKGKTARVLFTSDGPWYYQWLLLQPVRTVWWLTRLRFCGIRMESFSVFDSMRLRDEKNREKLLEKVTRIAKRGHK